MKNYIIWNTAEHGGNRPTEDREKYILFENNNYYLWDSYTWQQVPIESGKIASEAISEDIARTQEVSEVKEYLSTHRFGTRTIVIFLEFYNTNIKPSGPPVGGRYDKTSESLSEHYPIRCPLSNGSLSDPWTDKWNGILPKVEDDPSVIYYSFGTFNIDTEMQIGDWTFPMPMLIGRDGTDGNDGKDGTDGVNMEFIYKRVRNLDEFYALEAPASDHYTPRYVPPYWNGAPIGVTIDETVEAVCSRSLNPDTGLWGDYSDPTIFAMYSKDGKSYRGFTIYAGFEDASHIPTKPTTGRWDPETDTVYFDDPDNEGWSVDVPSEELNIWKTSATFNTIGEKIEGWTSPVRYNAIVVKVNEYNRYYMASNRSSGVEAPDTDVDPTTEGWTINGNETSLSAEIPYLWSFERYVYSDGNIYQTSPVILRYYNDALIDDLDRLVDEHTEDIREQLDDTTGRLDEVEGTYAVQEIDSENGLISIITNYKDEEQKSFADIVVDAKKGEIKEWAGAQVDSMVNSATHKVNGLEGYISDTASSLNTITGEVNSASQKIDGVNGTISNIVMKSSYLWHRGEGSLREETPYTPNEGESFEAYETRMKADGWVRDLISEDMAALQITTNKIWQAVGDGQGGIAASIEILKNLEVEELQSGGSAIVLDADHIILHGETLARYILTDGLTVGAKDEQGKWISKTSIDGTTGTLSTLKAEIRGNLYSSEGFFGTYHDEGGIIVPDNGVHIGATGLYSSNFDHETESGFALFGDSYALYGADGSRITQQGIVAKTVTSSNEKYKTSIDEKGFQITSIDGETLAQFVVYDTTNNYVKLRLYGPNGYVELSDRGVQTFGPEDVEQRDNFWYRLNSVMVAPPTVRDRDIDAAIAPGQPINQLGAQWRGVEFIGSTYSRYSNGWKRFQDEFWYYNPEDTVTRKGYNLSKQYKYNDRYFTTDIALENYLVEDGDYISEPQWVGHPAFISSSEYDNYEFFSCYFYTFGNEGKLEVSQQLYFCQWGAGSNPTSKEYVPGALYKVVAVR